MNNIEKNVYNAKKLISYLLLTFVFLGISYLSFLFIYHHLSDKTSFIALNRFKHYIWFELVALMLIFYLLDSLRLYYILKNLNVKIPLLYLFKLTFINVFISNITPFATGGGFAQIYFISKKGVSIGNASAATSMRTLMPMVFFFITTPIILVLDRNVLHLFPSHNNWIFIFIVILGYILVIYWFYGLINHPKRFERVIHKLLTGLSFIKLYRKQRIPETQEKLSHEFEQFAHQFKHFFSGNKITVMLSILFTVLYLLVLFTFPIVLIHGLGYKTPFITIIAMQIVITFMTYLAPTPGATGVAEGGFSLIFSNFVAKSDIMVLTFSWRFFTLYIGVIIGLIVFYIEIFASKVRLKKG